MKTSIDKVKKGEYLTLKENGPVYIRGEYDRTEKKYELSKADDINHSVFVKASRACFVGFTY